MEGGREGDFEFWCREMASPDDAEIPSHSLKEGREGGQREREGSSLKKAEGGSIMLLLDRGAAVKAFYFSGVRICIAEMETIFHTVLSTTGKFY